jgi:hypothetical protein
LQAAAGATEQKTGQSLGRFLSAVSGERMVGWFSKEVDSGGTNPAMDLEN